jgi:putative zinc finger protein
MECRFDKELLTLWLSDQLTAGERARVAEHVTGCSECRQELESGRRLWELMGGIPEPEPPAGALVRFNSMLDTFKATEAGETAGSGIFERLKRLFAGQPAFAFAYSLLLVIAGAGVGHWLNTSSKAPVDTSNKQQLEALTRQVSDMREMIMTSLLQNPSASERIRGVSYTSEIRTVNKGVTEALLTTLNNDPNVNVRLVTLEALTHYANDPAVREGLVQSILQQNSPLVQAALTDVMLKLQEKRAIRPFRKLLEQKDLNVLVRNKIQATIARLI